MPQQEYEWDEDKRVGNLVKHGFDFQDASLLFEGPHTLNKGQGVNGEVRELATGLIDGRCATIVFTRRGRVFRIISLRSARHGERREHQAVHGI